jgi:TIR domain
VSRIFISYRRGDTNAWAGRLSDSLKAILGRINVFRDIEDIPPGVEFDTYIARQVGSCDVLIALIGPNWLSVQDEVGRRRLDDPKDFLRLEIATALKRNIPVIPVLVAAAAMPSQDDLPEELKPLSRRQAFELTDTHWSIDCQRLTATLKPYTHGSIGRPIVVRRIAAAAVVVAAVGVAILWFRANIGHKSSEISTNSNSTAPLPVAGAQGDANAKSNDSPATPSLVGAWPNGAVISVGFLNGSLAQRQKVEQVAPEWSRFANLKFQFVDQAKGDVRIRFSADVAPWSFRGTEALGIPAQCPTMTLVGIGDNSSISPYDRAAILHEFGHVLGFLDEIQNPNGQIPWRPEVKAAPSDYTYIERVTDCRAPLNQPITHQEQLENYRAFDPKSIMMAQIPPQYLTEKVSLGGSTDLSASDKAFAMKLYPKPGADSQALPRAQSGTKP